MAEFAPFPNLPAEIRIAVWDLVQPPRRIIGQVPCRECWSECFAWRRGRDASCSRRRQCEQRNHPDWRVRYIVHPRRDAVFPLLHACRESRAVWLPRFHRPARHLVCETGVPSQDEGDPTTTTRVRFDVPFINYEADILTVFDDWAFSGALNTVDHRPQTEQSELDPFAGLHRDRIRHAGFCESAEELWSGLLSLDARTLPRLQSLSLVRMGPLPPERSGLAVLPALGEMYPALSQDMDCVVRDVLYPGDSYHAFFHHWRSRDELFEPRSELPMFRAFHRFWKAFLWHLLNRDAKRGFSRDYSSWWPFMEYVGRSGSVCVLDKVDGCGAGGHSHEDMLNWTPAFQLQCQLLCEKGEADGLKALREANEGRVAGISERASLERLLPGEYVSGW
ncbi:hypothetical protein J3458_001866 [Metarhizium acridum]|uniref:2EXR domain-containing protein n=1 Tax=Metarhizium acridum (strain CQMa 102) TaxID=655827 RepID=E9DUR5_METAQ|nr:uncharacterized protein MAC_01363 [Metarhizium acridum CQMa 102]EFY92727.1 hypothetical protein MAC_01363 [Metarhizium acridum CQMa 102]KAG8425133.1 hypothetical protein J3458_001866 [Metarhizium acridum]